MHERICGHSTKTEGSGWPAISVGSLLFAARAPVSGAGVEIELGDVVCGGDAGPCESFPVKSRIESRERA